MPNHAPAKKLWAGRTHLYQSWRPRRLLFFVHGFGGENTATWFNFPTLLLDDPVCAEDDLLFYGYESRKQAANASAGLLFQRCEEFLSHPERFETALGYPRDRNFAYEKIIFISHSLGGPVVRAALLQALDCRSPWINKANCAFFAPATNGARAERFGSLLANQSPFSLAYVWMYARFRWPVVEDLRVNSPFLSGIYFATMDALSRGRPNFTSLLTLFGGEDRIIDLQKELEFDQPYRYVDGLDHKTVCKPRTITDEPYERLRIVLTAFR